LKLNRCANIFIFRALFLRICSSVAPVSDPGRSVRSQRFIVGDIALGALAHGRALLVQRFGPLGTQPGDLCPTCSNNLKRERGLYSPNLERISRLRILMTMAGKKQRVSRVSRVCVCAFPYESHPKLNILSKKLKFVTWI
jgi:hypothetical protein